MPAEQKIETHPVQRSHLIPRDQPVVPKVVSMRAYEAYSSIYSPQEELITGDCRGGFGVGELIAFLYARTFPKAEWRTRFEEALIGMKHL